jgi:crotonobetainyl-CoA:carnitine CoA-transferase CaiB-like acyl-CoA transferase
MSNSKPAAAKPLKGIRILSLSLNLPGPAALMRLRRMGAICLKLEPPVQLTAPSHTTGDPMSVYSPIAYDALHRGIRTRAVDLKTQLGQATLQRELAKADVLLTSFRPSALAKLGLSWETLHAQYPRLSVICIIGARGLRAEEPGHDLTYLAENDLISGLDLPATLYADMAGSLMATEAVLQAILMRSSAETGAYFQVALSDAAAHLALPRAWGLTLAGTMIGGGHAGYAVYPCQDGRVALAALEPHFAKTLCQVAGLPWTSAAMMMHSKTRQAIAEFVAALPCKSLDRISAEHDLPLHTLPNR